MNFFEAIKSGYSKSFQFSGRSVRSEFWYFTLFQVIVLTVLSQVSMAIFVAMLGTHFDPSRIWIVSIPSIIFSVSVMIPNIALGIRRFHDLDRTGWWMSWSFFSIWKWLVMMMSGQDLATLLTADSPYLATFMMIGTIEVLVWVIFICWMFVKGTEGENRFGPDPFMSHRNLNR